jgi:peptidyl-prolyl cis-trans isomerase C
MKVGWTNYTKIMAVMVMVASVTLPLLAAETSPSGDNVAMVNGKAITRQEMSQEIGRFKEHMSSMGRPVTEAQVAGLQKDVLEELITTELLYQESQKAGIKVDEAAFNVQMDKWKKRFPSEAEMQAYLKKMNFSEDDLKARFRRGMVIAQFIEKQLGPKAVVEDKETKEYYDGNPKEFQMPEQVRASHILIKVDPKADEATKAEARKKIEDVQASLKKGGDFAALAKEFSACPSSAKGGDLSYFSRGQMVKPFEDAAFALKPGEVSGVVETNFGYHLIKVIDKKPETTLAYEEVKAKLAQKLRDKKMEKEMDLYIENLKKTAKVERLLPETPPAK